MGGTGLSGGQVWGEWWAGLGRVVGGSGESGGRDWGEWWVGLGRVVKCWVELVVCRAAPMILS